MYLKVQEVGLASSVVGYWGSKDNFIIQFYPHTLAALLFRVLAPFLAAETSLIFTYHLIKCWYFIFLKLSSKDLIISYFSIFTIAASLKYNN